MELECREMLLYELNVWYMGRVPGCPVPRLYPDIPDTSI